MFNFIPAYAGKIPTIPAAMPKLNNIIMTFISTWHTSWTIPVSRQFSLFWLRNIIPVILEA